MRDESQKTMESEFPGRMAIGRRELEIAISWRKKLERARPRWLTVGFLIGLAFGAGVWVVVEKVL